MYKAKKQRGEMSYNQPYWLLEPTQEEIERSKVEVEYGHNSINIGMRSYGHHKVLVFTRYRTKKPIGNRNKKRYSPRIISGKEFYAWPPKFKTNPIVETIQEIYIQATCFSDVADFANYFRDRLPKEFWDEYLNCEHPVIESVWETLRTIPRQQELTTQL